MRLIRVNRYIPTPVGRFPITGTVPPELPVHPHACGEIASSGGIHSAGCGTSPRLWGDSDVIPKDLDTLRYIPTPVGRLDYFASKSELLPVHPHACGEICSMVHRISVWYGTSPRLWGDCTLSRIRKAHSRYIPTPVGRFALSSPYSSSISVHPHACGEILMRYAASFDVSGTSPRLWGDCIAETLSWYILRYIPTPVGRFAPLPCHGPPRPVHPHACGEINDRRDCECGLVGTSPRLWGDFPKRTKTPPPSRYIPTPVGRLLTNVPPHCGFAVHPHACGEILYDYGFGRVGCGTSPRLWGDCLVIRLQHQSHRYIPTPVGRFATRFYHRRPATVHPHACGEIVAMRITSPTVVGTSPRLWGDYSDIRR